MSGPRAIGATKSGRICPALTPTATILTSRVIGIARMDESISRTKETNLHSHLDFTNAHLERPIKRVIDFAPLRTHVPSMTQFAHLQPIRQWHCNASAAVPTRLPPRRGLDSCWWSRRGFLSRATARRSSSTGGAGSHSVLVLSP